MLEWARQCYRNWRADRRRRAEEKRILAECGCVCWCPACRQLLNDQHCEQINCTDVEYTCRCGNVSVFDFGYPVPVCIVRGTEGDDDE